MKGAAHRGAEVTLSDDTLPGMPCFTEEDSPYDDLTRELPCVTLLDVLAYERARLASASARGETTVFDAPVRTAFEPTLVARREIEQAAHREVRRARLRSCLAWTVIFGLVVSAAKLVVRATRPGREAPATTLALRASGTGSILESGSAAPGTEPVSGSLATIRVPREAAEGKSGERVAVALHALIDGRTADAEREYAELARENGGDATFATMARLLGRHAERECAEGSLAASSCPELRR